MKKYISLLIALLSVSSLFSQKVVNLWTDYPPTDNYLGIEDDNIPKLYIYKPTMVKDRNIAVVICPGGGYSHLAIDHEGHEFAKWLQSIGVTGVVLKYRMPNQQKNVPLEDLQKAISYTRDSLMAKSEVVTKVGVAGFSAGGHLASTASTRYDELSLRPDFAILFYPVISMGEYTHEGSKLNLLGENVAANDIILYSNENQVGNNTPPTILFFSDDDELVSPMNSILYYSSLKENNIPTSLYIFPQGGHGWGMNHDFKYHDEMLDLLRKWIDSIK